jgi:hypothetical protein
MHLLLCTYYYVLTTMYLLYVLTVCTYCATLMCVLTMCTYPMYLCTYYVLRVLTLCTCDYNVYLLGHASSVKLVYPSGRTKYMPGT